MYQAYDEAVASAAAQYLAKRAKSGRRPFCAVVGFVLPHNPFVCPEEDWSYYLDRVELPHIPDGYFERLHPAVALWRNRGRMENLTDEEIRMSRVGYYGLVTHLDRQVGVVMDALSRTPFEADTVVIFTADHGEMAGEHGLWGKPHFYDGAVSVPLIVSSPDRFREGRRLDEVVSLIDIAPTLVDLASAKPMVAASGTSLRPLLEEGRKEWASEAFSEHYDLSGSGEQRGRMVRKGRWKLVHQEGYRPQMFDLDADPHELNDLAEDPVHTSTREELHQRVMAGWSAKEIDAELQRRRVHHDLLGEWYATAKPPDHGRWIDLDHANILDAEASPQ